MTLSDLLTGYAQNGGTLTGDALRQSVGEVWPLLLSETRQRVLSVEDSGERDAVQRCFDAMVEAAGSEGAPLQSETLGQWSRTYRDPGRTRDGALKALLREYLGETGLLYRGWPA